MGEAAARRQPDFRDARLFWHSRLVEAHERYLKAAENYRELAEDIQQCLIPGSDATLAARRALDDELTGLAAYRHVLKVFMWVVLQGTEPPEE